MSDAMTKSLDDVIKERKKTEGKNKNKGGNKPGARRRTGGPNNRRIGRTPRSRNDSKGNRNDREAKNRPRKVARKPISKLGMSGRRFIRRTRAGGAAQQTTGGQAKPTNAGKRRLRVSNLDFNITHKDLMDLFTKFGSLTKNKIDYDDLGRSLGTAIVEYDKNESALKAIEEYNGATLDGKTLWVEFDKTSATKKVPTVGRRVIAKRDIRPARRDDRRDNRRDNRGGDRRDNRGGNRQRDNGRRDNNRRQGGGNRREGNRNNRDGGRRDNNRRGGNRRNDD